MVASKNEISHEPRSESAPTRTNGSEEGKPESERRHESQPDLEMLKKHGQEYYVSPLNDEGSKRVWTYSTIPGELDRSTVIQSVTYLVASDCYQDDINDEDCSREESSWQDDCEADD